jgi:hypothetical protein
METSVLNKTILVPAIKFRLDEEDALQLLNMWDRLGL